MHGSILPFLARLPLLAFDMLKLWCYFVAFMGVVGIELSFLGIHWTACKAHIINPNSPYVRKLSSIEEKLYKNIIFILRWYNVPGFFALINRILEILLGLMLGRFRDGSFYSLINVMIPNFVFATKTHPFQFPSTSTEVNCFFLMLCAKLSYEYEDVLQTIAAQDWKQGDSETTVKTFAYKLNRDFLSSKPKTIPPETYAFVRHDAKSVVICFRGTEPLSVLDWTTDFYAEPMTLSVNGIDVNLHRGFYTALTAIGPVYVGDRKKLRNSILEAIVMYVQCIAGIKDKQIFVCGHSLGAALATLFSFLVHEKHPQLAKQFHTICTIGEPIVGDEHYAHEFNRIFRGRAFRYQFASDVVTTDFLNTDHNVNCIPSFLGGLMYRHHQEYRYISYDRTIYEETEAVKGKVRQDRARSSHERRSLLVNTGDETWLRTVSRYVFPFFLSDHFPDGYQAAMRAAAERSLQATPSVDE